MSAFTASAEVDAAAARAQLRIAIDPRSVADRDELLTEGVFAVVRFLADATATAAGGRAVVDLRTPDDPAAAPPGAIEAFVEAVRGLVQAYTLETPHTGPSANLVVTAAAQEEERGRTERYLLSADGAFSRGARYDLREGRR